MNIYRCNMLYIHAKIYMKLYMYYVVHLHEDILCSDSLQLSRPRSDVKAKSHSTVPASPAKRDGVRQGVVRCLQTSKGHLQKYLWRPRGSTTVFVLHITLSPCQNTSLHEGIWRAFACVVHLYRSVGQHGQTNNTKHSWNIW